MSKYDDDEFKNIKTGVPSGNATQKASVSFLTIFTVVGVIFAVVILIFQDSIISIGFSMSSQNGQVLKQIIINSVIALLIGSIQAWIFKARIAARVNIFIGFSLLGGVIAGLIGGLLIDAGVTNSFVVGAITGALVGGISSLTQNGVMGNKKYGTQWFIYSTTSWAVIFSIGWTIGWDSYSALSIASAAGFLLIASGVSLVIFLNIAPQIEFS